MKKSEHLKNMTVLLAEDDSVVRESMVNVLELFAGRTLAVSDGTAAYEAYQNEKPDILILDIEMPGIKGLELAAEIRKEDETTPIFIVTSFNDVAHIRKAIPLKLVDYIIKPVTFDKIQQTLIKCVDYIDKLGLLLFDIDSHTKYNKLSGELIFENEKVLLGKREKELLDLFIRNNNKLLRKEYLEDVLFDIECTDTSLKNLVYRLKKKMKTDVIVNVKEMGYMYVGADKK